MKSAKLIFIIILFFGIIFANNTSKTQDHKSTDHIIDETKQVITIEVQQSTKDLMQILESTVIDGKIPVFKALRNKRKSKKKIKATTNNLEKIINNAIANIEEKYGNANTAMREKTNKFVSKTKQCVFDMHKKMVSQIKKSMGKKPELVIENTNKTKNEIAKFEKDIILKIAKFSNKLKDGYKKQPNQ